MTILNAMRNALNSDPSAVLVATSPEDAAKKCKTARDQEAVRLARLASESARHGVDVAEIPRQFELFAGRASIH